jgi:hypothetical protein
MNSQIVMQVVMMVTPEHPPFAEYSKTEGLSGFDVDYINAVCGQTELECPIVTAKYSEAWPNDNQYGYMGNALMRGDFDCAASSGITSARNATLLFSQPYTQREVGIMIEKKSHPVGLGAPNKKIGVVKSSSCDRDLATTRLPQAKAIFEYLDATSLIAALTASVIDAALVCGMAHAMKVMNTATMQVATQQLQAVSEGLAFMCHPRMTYQVNQLNLAILSLRSTESGITLKNICDKYPHVQCEYTRFPYASAAVASRGSRTNLRIPAVALSAALWVIYSRL